MMEMLRSEAFAGALAGAVMVLEYVMVLASVLADLWSGVRKARERGEARRSQALRRTVAKLAQYYNALLALSVVDVMQMSLVLYVRVSCQWGVPLLPVLTVAGAIGIACIEVKSIYEKAEDKQRKSYRDAAHLLLEVAAKLREGHFKDMNV